MGFFNFRAVLAGLFLGAAIPLGAADPAPERVVSLIPSHTELLQALGLEKKLAGVSDGEDAKAWPGVPRVGGLQPNWEALVSVKPDLVLADASHKRFKNQFDRFHLPVLYLVSTDAKSFEDVFGLLRQTARRFRCPEKAEDLIAGYRARLKALAERVPKGPEPKVYFEIWPRPPQACGPASLQGHLVEKAGARNILPRTRSAMPLVSWEWVVSQAPDVILHTGVLSEKELKARPGWDQMPAARNGRVYKAGADKFSRASPGIFDAFEDLLGFLYGPVLKNP